MPIIKSAIKRAKQSTARRSRNLQVKRAVKQDITALHEAIAAGTDDVQTMLSAAYSEIDRAAKKGALHQNTAARKKSRLAAAVAKAATAAATPAAKAEPAKKAAAGSKKAVAKKPAVKKAPSKKPAVKPAA